MGMDFGIKRGDTVTKHVVTLKENGSPIDLTPYTVTACFKLGSLKFTRTYAKVSPETGGVAERAMTAADYTGDFIKNGNYSVEFKLVDGAGAIGPIIPNTDSTATFTIYGSVCA